MNVPNENIFITAAYVLLLLCLLMVYPLALKAISNKGPDNNGDWQYPRRERGYQNLAEERFQMVCDYLGLGKKQKKQARPLFDEAQKKRDEMLIDLRTGKLDTKDASNAMKEIENDCYEKLSALLNEKQREKLKKLNSNKFLNKM